MTPVDERIWPGLVDAATLDSMRERSDELAPDAGAGFFYATRGFFNQGSVGGLRDLLDDDDLERYSRRVAELVSPDLATWVHHATSG